VLKKEGKEKLNINKILRILQGYINKGKGHPCTGTEALYRPYGP
jgi:hypothetical protein